MASSSRVILAVLVATAVGLALCIALIFGALDRLSLRTAETNVDFQLSQLRDTIEANVGLGLQLSDIRAVQDMIERTKAADDQILAVEVFAPDGISLFNTDRGSIGEPVSPTWANAIRYRIENERWRVEELGYIIVGSVLRNDFAEPVGYLAIVVSGESRALHARAVVIELAWQAAWLVPLVLGVVLAALLVVLGFSNRGFRLLARRLSSDLPPGESIGLSPQLAASADAVRVSVDRAVNDFEQATTDVLKIDETEERHAA